MLLIEHKGGEKIRKKETNRKRITLLSLILFSVFLLLSLSNVTAAQGDTIYVNASGGNDSWDGQSAAYNGTSGPKLTIKNATDVVNVNGTVNIANGTYYEYNITITKSMKINGESETGTIIDGNLTNTLFFIGSGITVTMSNLTLTNGKTTSNGGAIFDWTHESYYYYYNGGAIHNRGNLTIINCNFTNNNAFNNGAGGAIYNDANLNVTGSSFINNGANKGGAIYNCANANVTFSRIYGNSAYQGNSIYNWLGTTNAQLNWWGSNAGPSGITGAVNTGVWFVLQIIADTTILYGETSDITILMLNDSNGVYHDPANGGVYNIPVALTGTKGTLSPSSTRTVNGIVQSVFTATSGGNAVINAIVDGQTVSIGIAVNPTYSTLTSVNNFKGQNVTLIVNVVDIDGKPVNEGQITFKVNGTIVGTVNVISGQAKLNWTIPLNWNTGNYNIATNYSATNYASSDSSTILTVDKTPTSITIDQVHNFSGQNVTLIAHISDYYHQNVENGQVKFSIGSASPVMVNVNSGLATVNWTIPFNWAVGNYDVVAEYMGTNNLTVSNVTGSLIVDKMPTNLTASNASNFYHQYVDIVVNLTDYYGNPLANGLIKFQFDNDSNSYMSNTDSNGLTTLHYQIVQNAGNSNIMAIFDGNSNYTTSTNNGTLTITKTPTHLTMDNVTSFPGQNIDLTVDVFDYYENPLNSGMVIFKANGTIVGTTNISLGVAFFPNWKIPSNWDAGTYELMAEFVENNNYLSNSTNSTLEADLIPTTVHIDPVTGYKTSNVTLYAKIENTINDISLKGKSIDFYVNGTKIGYGSVNDGGIAACNYLILENIGVYNITAVFNGDTQFTASNSTNTLTVNPTFTNVTINPINGYKGDNITLTAKLWDLIFDIPVTGRTMDFFINGTKIGSNITDINGIATYDYTIIENIDNHVISAVFNGDEQFGASNNSSTLSVNATPTIIVLGNAIVNNGQNVVLNATLWDTYHNQIMSGQKITFKVNGVTIGSAVTDANGVASITYNSNLIGGYYPILAEFDGDTQFARAYGNSTLNVPQANLYVHITTNKKNPQMGELFTVTYKLGNHGPATAKNVTVTIKLPKGFQIMGIHGDGNLAYDKNNRILTWTLQNVPVGDPYLYVTGRNINTGNHLFTAKITSMTYNSNTDDTSALRVITHSIKNNSKTRKVNAASQINTVNITTGNITDTQQKTVNSTDKLHSNGTTTKITENWFFDYWWIILVLLLIAGGLFWFLFVTKKGE